MNEPELCPLCRRTKPDEGTKQCECGYFFERPEPAQPPEDKPVSITFGGIIESFGCALLIIAGVACIGAAILFSSCSF